MGIKIVPRHGSTLKEKLYLPAIFGGMKTTLSHLFTNLGDSPEIKTINYPEELPHDINERYRGVHRLTKREDGSVRCVACFMCATACPAECIFIEAEERSDGVDEKMPKFWLISPTFALVLGNQYIVSCEHIHHKSCSHYRLLHIVLGIHILIHIEDIF
jgi:formate hydrogenlyase subunit 6/NADH:ubiquinone oxidoreductase subunit I